MMPEKNRTQLVQDLYRLVKRLPHLQLNVQPIPGLTNSEQELLVVLRMNTTGEKPALPASEIANLLHITPAGGSHLFNPLERAGYLQRMQDPRDRRVARIGLTEKGIQATDALLVDIQGQIAGLIDFLGEADSQAFISLLAKVFDYLASQPAAPKEKANGREAAQLDR